MVRLTHLMIGILCSAALFAQNVSNFIHVDQFGYVASATKVAVLSNPQSGYNSSLSYSPGFDIEIRKSGNDSVIMVISPQIWNSGNEDPACGDAGWWIDFSDLATPGSYYVHDFNNNESSATFVIHDTVYQHVMKTAGRTFFYNRCNFIKATPYAESNWTDDMNFMHALQDANCRYIYDPSNPSLEKELSGGWFDAGDYNKYVTFAYQAVHNLLSAYEENPMAFNDDWNIPESGNGIPDILDEVIWELDWLLKMNNHDGSTHIKMGSQNHNENAQAPPSVNTDQRFYGPTCSSASIAVAGMFAHAATVLQQIPSLEAYCDTLSSRAEISWSYVLPLLQNNQLETTCDDGSIVAGDADWDESTQRNYAVAAAARLYKLTEDASYENYVVSHYDDTPPISDGFWGPYIMPTQDALLAYTMMPNANSGVKNAILNSLETAASNNWNGFFGFNEDNLYRAFMPSWSYHWGSNQVIANYGNLNFLLVNNNLLQAQHDDFELYAAEIIHYLHGVNPQGMVYLSNMYDHGAERCVNQFYHTWFANGTDWDDVQTSLYGPAPGYVPGGPNHDFSVNSISPPAGQPDQKSYLDFNNGWPDNSWEITENAIYYQAAYLRLLANFVNEDGMSWHGNIYAAPESIEIYPNPVDSFFTIRGELHLYDIEILDINGQVILNLNTADEEVVVNTASLGAGMYFVRLHHQQTNKLYVQKIIKSN